MNFNFMHLALDIIGGSILGSLAYTIELSIASASTFALISTNANMYAMSVGGMVLVGCIFFKVGSKMYAKADKEIEDIEKQ